jgi:hypothetical protein
MKTQSILAASAFVVQALAGPAAVEKRATISNANTPPVTTKNNAFYASGKRFYIRGIDYQPGTSSIS